MLKEFMSNFFTEFIILGIIVSAVLVLGLFVLAKNWRNRINLYFFLVTVSVSLWNLCAFASEAVSTTEGRLMLSRLSYLFACLALYLVVLFMYKFLGRKTNKIINFFNHTLIIVTAILLLFSSLIVSSITEVNASFTINGGILYPIFFLAVVFYVIQFIIFPVIDYKKARGTRRNQIKFLFLGFALYIISVLFFNFGTRLLANSDIYYRYGNYAVIFLIGFMSYALIKHRLMDIRMVVARSVAFTILIGVLAGFYAAVILAAQALVFPNANYSTGYISLQIALAIIMAFSFQPLRRWVTKITDKIFFKNSYDKDELLSELSHTLGSTIVLIEMLYKVSDILTRKMKVSRTLFTLIKDEDRLYTVQANGYKSTPEVDPRDIQRMAKDGLMIADELPDNSTHKRLLRSYDAAIAIPLKTEKEVVGVLLLGEKSSGDMYSQQDMAVLEIIAPEISVAIENAKSYEEINRFNVTLRQEVKHATSRLKLKNEQLMELDKAKDEFISMASHQLRTPLTAIKGYLSMLLEGDAGDIKVSQYDFINEAYSGANRMVGLINDLLNVSRMETGRFFLEPKELDIERVVEEEIKQLSNAAKTKGLYLKVEKKGKVPHIWADETKIRQVVMNFMDNAIYYTNTGGITVMLKHDKNDFIYEVHDTGIGVPRTQLEHLFEKFFRADNARTARPDGTGLGIYLAKRVVEDHGGQIIFDSVEGKGSMFGFRFPLKKKVESKPISTPAPRVVPPTPVMPMATEIAEKNKAE